MRRPIIVMFCALFWLTLAPAWSAADAPAQDGMPRGALFKVDGAGHTLYLFGTMHVGLPEFFPLEARLRAALAAAPVLALEIDPLKDPPALQLAMQQSGLYPPGSQGQQQAMPAALRPRLAQALQHYQMTPEAVQPFRPWLLSTVLALAEFTAQGYRPELSVDNYLARQAHARGQPVLELESVTAQLALFGNLSDTDQWRMLTDSVDGILAGTQVDQVRDIVEAWRHADRAALDKLATEAEADTTFSGSFLQHVVLDGRNPALSAGIAALLARENHAVAAIGVLHLLGEHSVPALLRARGLTVQRVY